MNIEERIVKKVSIRQIKIWKISLFFFFKYLVNFNEYFISEDP